jgi:hypothetical protein
MKLLKTLLVLFLLTGAVVIAQEKKPVINMYVIKKGDTLWDISSRFLANPWLWPKIWEQNKYIENPDLIFPGEPLVLPEGVSLPPAPPKEITPPPQEAEKEALPEEALMEKPEEERTGAEVIAVTPPEETSIISEEGKAVFEKMAELQKEKGTRIYFSRMAEVSFVTEEELKTAGKIVGSPLDRNMFGEFDRVYVDFSEAVGAGDTFAVVREMGDMKHPVTKKKIGKKVRVKGILEVLEKNDKNYTATIKASWDVIERGDRVMKLYPPEKTVEIKKASSPLEGYVIDGNRFGEFFGEGDVVFIDIGKEKGVEEGNVFIVYVKEGKEKPINIIGKAVVIKTWEKTSAALLTKTKQEVEKGYRVMSDVF